ncbi:hypothetical protein PGB90_001771 [Kerria lacca]
MAANKEESKALVTFPQDVPQLPDLKGKIGGATIKASEDESSIAEMQKKITKNEGGKHLEQKSHKIQKQDSSKTAEASIKTTNEGGVRRTVATTVVTSSSSFEEEETMEQIITSAPTKCITQK